MAAMNNSQRIIINLYKNHYYNGIWNSYTQLSFALYICMRREAPIYVHKSTSGCLYCYQTIQTGKQNFKRVYILVWIRSSSESFYRFSHSIGPSYLILFTFAGCEVWMQNLAFFVSTNNMLKICYKSCAFLKMFTSSYHCEI